MMPKLDEAYTFEHRFAGPVARGPRITAPLTSVTARLHIRNHMVTLQHRQAAVFRAIADPTRREILGMLRGGPRSVGEIAADFRASRPAISKHLRVLRSVGLISTQQVGTARICTLNAVPLRAVNDWLSDYRELWGATLRGLKRYVEDKR
jgi:DNA-binding transcriptional ArsR family regulator